jgi:HSP20 family protein
MAIVRWFDPFRDMAMMQERMNRFFEGSLSRVKDRNDAFSKGLWSPSVDICETAENVIVKAEIPGVNRDDISIEVKDGILSIKGERKFEKEVKEENYHLMEREFGTFHRSFSLPTIVDQEKVSASYKSGVLEILLPKKDDVKGRQIEIEGA